MIDVEQLTKHFGHSLAVERLTFSIGRGEIVGFLGPNGAGKTTTMRMLTTYLPPSSGRARLAGHDVLDDSIEVRKSVGYLPENVPIYPEMRVRDYLNYRSKLKDVSRARRRIAVERVMERCQIIEMERKVLGHLSKGYRQRVGLADAMLHDPDILILDEPTAGLDPIQIREVRGLIRNLGEEHTILLSTHIMSEVEAVCGRVLMIVRGRIVRDERLEELGADQLVVIEARGPAESLRASLGTVPGVTDVRAIPGESSTTFEIRTREDLDLRETLARRIFDAGGGMLGLERRRSRLEDWFVEAVRESSVIPATPVGEVA